MNKKLVLVGAGGHANVLYYLLKSIGKKLSAIVTNEKPSSLSNFAELDWYDSDEKFISENSHDKYLVINGVGPMPGNMSSTHIFELYKASKFYFYSVLAPSAIISEHVILGEGVNIMHGAIIQPGVTIGDNSLINTGAIIDHDCKIGSHNHIAPGACLSGGVVTGCKVHVGTGATIIQSISVADNVVVGAGVSLVRNISAGEVVIPAAIRRIRKV